MDELALHRCINFRFASGRVFEWEFKIGGQASKYLPQAALTFNDTELVLQAVLRGRGIAQLSGYQVCEYLASEALVMTMARYAPDDRGHYICYLSRQHLPSRIRVFIDFMTEHIRALGLHCLSDFNAQYPAARMR